MHRPILAFDTHAAIALHGIIVHDEVFNRCNYMLNNLFVDCMTMTVRLRMDWVGLGRNFLIKSWVGLGWVSKVVGWVLKIGPTAMSDLSH